MGWGVKRVKVAVGGGTVAAAAAAAIGTFAKCFSTFAGGVDGRRSEECEHGFPRRCNLGLDLGLSLRSLLQYGCACVRACEDRRWW